MKQGIEKGRGGSQEPQEAERESVCVYCERREEDRVEGGQPTTSGEHGKERAGKGDLETGKNSWDQRESEEKRLYSGKEETRGLPWKKCTGLIGRSGEIARHG